ncbi:caspase family protein [Candidatus Magnetaquicoccus inordinatus]|uniref:caspase family protein n=1 Tax=Candidatus Magnetaquicoccus inordinatus TaxID=2496818 RepID=UPI00102B0758|nr:caspase family protein [Candidatus Magnetaquicoccus inordinatus]
MKALTHTVHTTCRLSGGWRLLICLLGLLLSALPVGQAQAIGEYSNPCIVAREMAIKAVAIYERDADQGIAAMNNAASLCSSDPGIAFNLGLAYYMAGNSERAEAVWDSLNLMSGASEAANREKALANLAWLKFELGKDKESLQLANEGLQHFPSNWSLAHSKIYSLFRLGRYLEAYDWLTRSGLTGVRASQWQNQAAEYVVETLWRKFRECLRPQKGKPCEHDGQLPAIRQAINLLIKEYPQDTHFIEAKDRLLGAYLDKEADQPYPIDLPHEIWKKTGVMDDQSPLLDETIQAVPPIAAWEKREDAYAVIVGINRYQHLRARHFAERDARHMQRILVQRGIFKNDVDHVRMRIDQEASLSTIRDDLQWLVRQGQLNPGAVLLFYFAGWGAPLPGEEGMADALLLPVESRPEGINPQAALSLASLQESLNRLKNVQAAVIIDSCFNENAACSQHGRAAAASDKNSSLSGTALQPGAEKKEAAEFFQGRASWLLASLRQPATLYSPGRQGSLTYFLLKGLLGEADGQDQVADGWVDLTEAFQYVQKQLPNSDVFLSKPLKMRLSKSKGER